MRLAAMISNYNKGCYKQYKEISKYLGSELYNSLKDIERFYYSDYWINRVITKFKENDIPINEIKLDIILGTISDVIDTSKFEFPEESINIHGSSDKSSTIKINSNIDELTDTHINNVIMHEVGHRLYNEYYFKDIVTINNQLLKDCKLYIQEHLPEKDFEYFTDSNELRLRIIPIIKEMKDNKWTALEAYNKSTNLKNNDIYHIYEKEFIIDLLNNII